MLEPRSTFEKGKGIVRRFDDGEEGALYPIILNEERQGLRVMQPDFPEEERDRFAYFDQMDSFTQEERAWNPYYLDFYRPQHERDDLFNYRERR